MKKLPIKYPTKYFTQIDDAQSRGLAYKNNLKIIAGAKSNSENNFKNHKKERGRRQVKMGNQHVSSTS